LKHEIGRKATQIPLYRQVQITGGDLIELSQIGIQRAFYDRRVRFRA
jgi:hypothetical protein